jgi:hypothetical protein
MTVYRRRSKDSPKSDLGETGGRKVVLAMDLTRNNLYALWVRACKKEGAAQLELHQLIAAKPELEKLFRAFAQDRKSKLEQAALARGDIPKVPPPPVGAWEQAMSKAGETVSIVSGGLPSLGKRR